jgi:hypothetical protein
VTAPAFSGNLSTLGRRRRALLGVAALAAGALLTSWLGDRDAAWPFALLTLPVFLLGTHSLVQAWMRLCTWHAKRGSRETEAGGAEPIAHSAERIVLAQRARSVWLRSIAAGLALTAVALAVLLYSP